MDNLSFDNASAPLDVPIDLTETITEIELLFIELAPLDARFGENHGNQTDKPSRFDGWRHPALVAWGAARGKDDLKRDLDGPELFILQKSLERQLVKLKQRAINA